MVFIVAEVVKWKCNKVYDGVVAKVCNSLGREVHQGLYAKANAHKAQLEVNFKFLLNVRVFLKGHGKVEGKNENW